MPPWADRVAMQLVYEFSRIITRDSGTPHHVDHIVPIVSKIVCGLHCEANLQILSGVDNARKKNLVWPDMP